MNKQISKFEFNQNDYPEGTILFQEYEYKGYFIREFEQKPCDRWIKAMRSEDGGADLLDGDERGEGGYEILDHTGEILEQDFYCMEDNVTYNAEVEVDFMLMDKEGKEDDTA